MKSYALIAGDFRKTGGMDKANYELAWYLAQTGSLVHLVAYSVDQPLRTHPQVIWHRVPKPFNRYTLSAPLFRLIGRKIARQVSAQGGKVLVNGGSCPWPGTNWVHAVHAAWQNRDHNAPWIFRLRQHMNKRIACRAERVALQMAQLILANSYQTRRYLIDRVGIIPERIHVVYFGVDRDVFKPPNEETRAAARTRLGLPANGPVIVFVGAMGYDRNKGFDVLFSAWQTLCRDPSWDGYLVAAGGGAEVELWRRYANEAGLSNRIQILGFTKHIEDLLAAADLLVSPTHYDAYGLAIHEALCCGLPAMVTKSAGISERYPAELSALLLEAPPSEQNLIEHLRIWQANIRDFHDKALSFGQQLAQRSWTDAAAEIVALMDIDRDSH